MKLKLIACALTLSILLLSGCGQPQPQSMTYIGTEQAKAAALKDAGLQEDSVTFVDIVLDKRDGTDYYNVAFSAEGIAYEYDIDALTGVVIESQAPSSLAEVTPPAKTPEPAPPVKTTKPNASSSSGASSKAGNTPTQDMISAEQAKSKALSHAGLTSTDVTFVQAKLERDDGKQIYDVEFYTKDYKEYDYEIDAYTGAVISYDFDAEHYTAAPPADSSISADEAKKIALEQVPGATSSNFREFETDYDDGRLVYEGTIIYNNNEYEFEIDGYSGAIRSWEAEPVGR